MADINLGRVQGAGFFYSVSASNTWAPLTSIYPRNIKPLVGDMVVFPNGDVRIVTGVTSTTVTCGGLQMSLKGEDGTNGTNGTDGADGVTPNISATASVSNTTGTPSVTVTKSGTAANPSFNFAFSNIKGDTGEVGDISASDITSGILPVARGGTGVNNLKAAMADLIQASTTSTISAGEYIPAAPSSGSTAYRYTFKQLKDWLVGQGLDGATGPTGPAGPTGPRGPAGPAGATKYLHFVELRGSDTAAYFIVAANKATKFTSMTEVFNAIGDDGKIPCTGYLGSGTEITPTYCVETFSGATKALLFYIGNGNPTQRDLTDVRIVSDIVR